MTLGNSVTRIEERTFESCTNLTSVRIPASVTTIGDFAFGYCANLASVTIPNSVTRIADGAFYGCVRLTDITIPASVTFLWQGSFRACTSLTNFSVDSANSDYSSHDGVLFDKAQTTLIAFPPGRGGNYVIPDSVTAIGSYAFALCAGLTNVTIPNSVRDIGPYVFGGCTGLTSMTIPASVLNIWHGESLSYTSLTNITFLGDPPVMWEPTPFENVGPGATIYYYYGTTGWQSSYAGLPTMMLGAPASQVGTATAGMKPGGFGFTITGVIDQTIVVEASTNLVTWQPVWTNTLSGVSADFVDPQSPNHPRRFYRTRSN